MSPGPCPFVSVPKQIASRHKIFSSATRLQL
jgi:hypothetical protein